jgi:proteic killer suppression protein
LLSHYEKLEVNINNKELEKLYTTGLSKKLKLPDNVVNKFFATIQKIDAAVNIYDIWENKGLKFEKLKGYDSRYSIRLNNKYRLEIEITWDNNEKTIGIFSLVAISVHYGN